ncbi:MAG: ribosome-binding factor A [Firmicutes bacterium GWF2_51_9]|jgi:ribosome-binding factor A|nr:30S ribosome-binding factor RbfA [Erysipelotrichaceae bacterium]OGS52858.1 MAG: ribosome-binding factor A [Firmicutes bacterium GWF2_51_9]OGS59064.1 MAG: ribosome-binding factor A [Firmicutes bacterium GWE2_51_13]HAM64132.1 30S ribosome-binding factor RbfA [Erysipelotrichaceae bacterium]HAO60791.1 30S ribosome-binding factor RbfA [Erysipelotrichaceae bacterium]
MAIRQERLAGIILKEISEMIQFEVKDPNIGFVTVTGVDLTNDNSYCKIYVTFLDKSKNPERQLEALNRTRGFLRSALGKKLATRKTPELSFHLDTSFDQGQRIDTILNDVKKD